jgi:fucose permease
VITERRAITYCSYSAMLFLGVGIAIIGAAARNIGLTAAQIGLLISAQHLGFVIAVLITGALADRLPKPRLLLAGSVVLGAAFLAFYRHDSFAFNLAVMFTSGAGIGIIEGAADALLLDLHREHQGRYIAVNHLYTTLGAALITALFAALQAHWQGVVTLCGLALFGLAELFRRTAAPPTANREAPIGPRLAGIRQKGLVALLFAVTVLAVGLELGTVGYLTTFLMDARGFSQVDSKLGLIAFLAGIAAGRLLVGLCIRNDKIVTALLVMFGLSLVCFTGLYYLNVGPLVFALIALAGLTVSALAPLLICLGGLIAPEAAGAVIGLIKVAIPVGGMVLPFTIAQVALRWPDRLGAQLVAFPVAALLALALLYAARSRLRAVLAESPERPC